MQMSKQAKASAGTVEDIPRTFRELVQKKLLDEVIGASDAWKVLVMDTKATRMVSAALTMFDIMEKKVTLVEQLQMKRQPFPQIDVIYVAEPTLASVKKISEDFESRKNAKYGNVHIFFLDALSADLFSVIQNNALLVSKVKTFKEINLDYLAVESSVFHFDMPDALEKMYGSLPDSAYPSVLGRKLANLCITLNEHPCIRYQQSSAYSREIANALHQTLMQFKRANTKFWCQGDDKHTDRERGQILILDRSFDPLSPLMHEYTYQAMVNDLLDIEDGVVNYETQTNTGTAEKQALLNENDEIWVEQRHNHIAKVIESIKDRMDDIIQNNSALAGKGADSNLASKDITTMANAIKKLPEYTQTMTKLGQHVALAQQCMNNFSKQHLMDLSQVEQTISTGFDEDGKEVNGAKLFKVVSEVLQSSIGKEQKLRLLCIYYVAQKNSGEDYVKQAIALCGLNANELKTLTNFDALMTSISGGEKKGAEKKEKGGMFSSIFRGKAVKHASTPEGEYADTRHVCQLKLLLEQFLAGELSADRFPAMGPALSTGSKAAEAKSVRKFGANSRWAKKDNISFTGGRNLVFLAGGVTFAELRVGGEMMQSTNKEVIVGGSSLVSPYSYMVDIGSLKSGGGGNKRGDLL